MNNPEVVAKVVGRSTYAQRNYVFGGGTSPTVMANWGYKSPPPLILVSWSSPSSEDRGSTIKPC